MAPLERAVLLRSLGTNSGKFYLPKKAGRTFKGSRLREGKCLARKEKPKSNFPEFLSSVPPTGVDRIRQAVLYKGDMTREWSGCQRRRRLRPPSQIPTARRGGHGYAFVSPADLPLHHRPNPTVPHGDPGHHVLRQAQGFAVAPAGRARFRHRGSSPCQARQPGTRCLFRNRPVPCATDGQHTPEDFREPQRAGFARGWLRNEPANDRRCLHRRSGRPSAGSGRTPCARPGPVCPAEIRPEAPGARRPSCGLRPAGTRQDRRFSAWHASPQGCGPSPRCRASCRRRRMAIRSGQGAKR